MVINAVDVDFYCLLHEYQKQISDAFLIGLASYLLGCDRVSCTHLISFSASAEAQCL